MNLFNLFSTVLTFLAEYKKGFGVASLILVLSLGAYTFHRLYKGGDFIVITQGYDILKQNEKLKKDPSDIKTTDLDKFLYVCDHELFLTVIERQENPFKSDVKDGCNQIKTLRNK